MNAEIKWHLLNSRLQRMQTVDVSRKLRDQGIESIVLKGAAVERYYPENEPRPSVDLDIAVPPGRFEKALDLRSKGELGNYNVDLHEGLRHFDTREWDAVFERTSLVDLEEGPVRMLSPEDQLRLISIHWLTDGGERKERLWDIHHIIRKKGRALDWDYCLNANGPKRRLWLVSVVGLAHKYTGLSIDNLPFKEEALELPAWLTRTLEDRWGDDVKFSPLQSNLASISQFFRQLRLRFPPNAVMATVALEGDFDDGRRLPYQMRYFIRQMWPSIRRIAQVFTSRFHR